MAGEAPSVVGAKAELAVATGLRKAGMDIFVPFFCGHSRIDLIAVDAGCPIRVQVKTARMVRGTLFFNTYSQTGIGRQHYHEQIDAFGVYSPHVDLVYLVPIAGAPNGGCTLRMEPTQNKQQANVRWAADYLIGPP